MRGSYSTFIHLEESFLGCSKKESQPFVNCRGVSSCSSAMTVVIDCHIRFLFPFHPTDLYYLLFLLSSAWPLRSNQCLPVKPVYKLTSMLLTLSITILTVLLQVTNINTTQVSASPPLKLTFMIDTDHIIKWYGNT
jgi:hypothetical protein